MTETLIFYAPIPGFHFPWSTVQQYVESMVNIYTPNGVHITNENWKRIKNTDHAKECPCYNAYGISLPVTLPKKVLIQMYNQIIDFGWRMDVRKKKVLKGGGNWLDPGTLTANIMESVGVAVIGVTLLVAVLVVFLIILWKCGCLRWSSGAKKERKKKEARKRPTPSSSSSGRAERTPLTSFDNFYNIMVVDNKRPLRYTDERSRDITDAFHEAFDTDKNPIIDDLETDRYEAFPIRFPASFVPRGLDDPLMSRFLDELKKRDFTTDGEVLEREEVMEEPSQRERYGSLSYKMREYLQEIRIYLFNKSDMDRIKKELSLMKEGEVTVWNFFIPSRRPRRLQDSREKWAEIYTIPRREPNFCFVVMSSEYYKTPTITKWVKNNTEGNGLKGTLVYHWRSASANSAANRAIPIAERVVNRVEEQEERREERVQRAEPVDEEVLEGVEPPPSQQVKVEPVSEPREMSEEDAAQAAASIVMGERSLEDADESQRALRERLRAAVRRADDAEERRLRAVEDEEMRRRIGALESLFSHH